MGHKGLPFLWHADLPPQPSNDRQQESAIPNKVTLRELCLQKSQLKIILNDYQIVQGLPDYASAKVADAVMQHQRNWGHLFKSLAFHFSRMHCN